MATLKIRDVRQAGQIEALTMIVAGLVARYAMSEDPDSAVEIVEDITAIMPPLTLEAGDAEAEAFADGFLRVLNQIEGFARPRVHI